MSLVILLQAGGCRSAKTDSGSITPGNTAASQEIVASEAARTIAAECAHGSFTNVSNGLIVETSGLHEDVFSLRNRSSLKPEIFQLRGAIQLESMLRGKIAGGRYEAQQIDCIEKFTEHLQTLSDPLVEADKEQKELDLSAFNKARKEAEEEQQSDENSSPAISPN